MKAGFYGVCSCQGLFQQDLKFKKEEIMKKWMVLMLAVGFVLTASFSAQADSVLLPWIVKDNAISTIVTLVNTADPVAIMKNPAYKVRFHMLYKYKNTTANGQLEGCQEYDFCVPTSYNDILVFDAAGNFNNGAPLFGDTTVQGVKYAVNPSSLALPVDGPRRAFLIATNEIYRSEACGAANMAGPEGTIYAEAMVVDIANGAAWGYDGYNPNDPANATDFESSLNFNDNDTDTITDALGQVVARDRGEVAFLTIMPPSVFTTKLFVTPINPAEVGGMGLLQAQLVAGVQLYCDLAILGNSHQDKPGMFDYDERCISFNVVKGVVCTDASEISHYISEAAWNVFRNTRAEGWAYLALVDDPFQLLPLFPALEDIFGLVFTRQAAIGKLEYSLGTASFDGNSVKGAINNFIWLRGRALAD